MGNSNLDVARKWINTNGRGNAKSSNGNMSYTDNVLYSYSTPIATLQPNTRGHWVALVTTEAYSVTTEGKHKNAARKATGYGVQVALFHVPFLLLTGHGFMAGRSAATRLAIGYTLEEQHAANLEDYRKRIVRECERMERARVYKSPDTLDRLIAERTAYAAAFGLTIA